MNTVLAKTVAVMGAVAALAAAGPAAAQYYAPPPPPGYYAPDPYYRAPPPRPRVPYGARCETTIDGAYGPQQMICPIRDPKPLGEPCGCPPPRGSGYGRTFIGGTTIR